MNTLPDPESSRAVLIGVSNYTNLTRIESSANNVRELNQILTDPRFGPFKTDLCTMVQDPRKPEEVFPLLRENAGKAKDTFLVYFSGHGMIDDTNDLHLCLTRTSQDDLWYTALPYKQVRETLRYCPARRRIVVLDCCFSGNAIATMSGTRSFVPSTTPIEGTYVLTATGATEEALAPEDHEFTAFSGTLIKILRRGVPEGPELLTFSLL